MTQRNLLRDRALRTLLEQKGLPAGTSLENRVTWRLHKFKAPRYEFQYPVGPYRIDYAWPAKRVALEVDGPHHWRPDVAVKDVMRDAYLRANGWLVLRIDDTDGAVEAQLVRVLRAINSIDRYDPTTDAPQAALVDLWERQVIAQADRLTESP